MCYSRYWNSDQWGQNRECNVPPSELRERNAENDSTLQIRWELWNQRAFMIDLWINMMRMKTNDQALSILPSFECVWMHSIDNVIPDIITTDYQSIRTSCQTHRYWINQNECDENGSKSKQSTWQSSYFLSGIAPFEHVEFIQPQCCDQRQFMSNSHADAFNTML